MDLDNAQNEENVWNNPDDVTTFGAKPATGLESFLDLMQDMKYYIHSPRIGIEQS